MFGMKFKYLSFNKIEEEYKGISVFIDGKEVACGLAGDVLRELSAKENANDIPDYEIVTARPYFGVFVIELKSF